MSRSTLEKIVDNLLKWYHREARILPWREYPTAYHVWISEIMLQQTRVEAVKPYFERFITQLPDVKELAEVSEETLFKLWEGLGYYNRARNLQKAAKIIMEKYHGKIPNSYEELIALPGIGEYTAGAISSIAFGLPYPAVDGNVLRVLSRLTGEERICSQTKVKREITEEIQKIIPKNQPGEFNQALMELGASVCIPNGLPLCHRCPIQKECFAFHEDRVLDFPVKAPKKRRVTQQIWVFFIINNKGYIAIRKRNQKGVLHGLWEFPSVICDEKEMSIFQILNKFGILKSEITTLEKGKHIFTHIQWNIEGFFVEAAEIKENSNDFIWVSQDELIKNYAVPTAFKKILEQGIELLKKNE